MNIQAKHITQPFLIGVLFFLVFFTILQYRQEYQQTLKNNKQVPPQEYMKDVQVIHFTKEGQIKDQIHATYWAYLPEQQLSVLTMPYLMIKKPNNAHWTVNAKQGIAYHPTLQSKVDKLELKENVIVDRIGTDVQEPIQVTSEKLDYFPDKDYVETDLFVKLIKPGLTVTGTGMHGYLEKNWVELLKDVTTYYVRADT